jgi:CRP-like cAMP-binding protein
MVDEVQPERLDGIAFLSDLTAEDRQDVAAKMRLKRVPVGGVLAEEGDLSTTFAAILSGTVTVHRAGRHVADLGPGDVVGEAGTATLQPRNATVIATTATEIAVLMGWDLRDLIERFPSIKARVEAIVASRSGGSS